MSKFPKGWAAASLSDCAEFNPRHPDDVARSTLVSFVPMPAVDEHTGEIARPSVRPLAEVWKGYTHFREGDVIVAKITPCMENGKAAVARTLENGLACGSTEFHVLRPYSGISPDFLWQYVRQRVFREEAEQSMTGAVGQRRVPVEFLKKSQLALPPEQEQQRIVAKINSLSAKSKRARVQLNHVPRLVEKYKQAVLAAAFAGDLTEEWRKTTIQPIHAGDYVAKRQVERATRIGRRDLGRDERAAQIAIDSELQTRLNDAAAEVRLPETWCWSTVGVVFGVYVGATPSRKISDYWNGSIPWVSSGEVAFCRIHDTRESITERGLAEASTRLHPPGTVLVGMIGEGRTRGQAAILEVEASNNQNCAAIRVSEAEYPPAYLFWHLWMSYAQTRTLGGGNNQQALNKERVQNLLLPIAPPNEAEEVVRRIEIAFAWIDRLTAEVTSARKLVDRLDQAVLAKAFRGGLVPQDPADEPASVLMDRIHAEKNRATAAKPRRGRPRLAISP